LRKKFWNQYERNKIPLIIKEKLKKELEELSKYVDKVFLTIENLRIFDRQQYPFAYAECELDECVKAALKFFQDLV
jgi:hypothetical protein